MTKLTFSTNEVVSLEKHVNLTCNLVETNPEDIDNVYEINRCTEWIQSNGFQKVCLQFPDYLLSDSSQVVLRLQSVLKQTVYLLGDTAYESCCIDYIAAAHINADAIIHYGPVCFSKTSANIPFINIYEKHPLDVNVLKADFDEKFKEKEVVLLVDTVYLYLYDKIESAFNNCTNVKLCRIDDVDSLLKGHTILFLGNNYRKLLNVSLNYKPSFLFYYDLNTKEFEDTTKIIKRRNFIIEKIKESETIGIIIGTLGIKNYLKILDRIKSLISKSGKKYYLISVGKPTVAKLANFPELDIYVVVTCSMNEIYESRDFYKPIATPFDVEAALNSNPQKCSDFTYDYNIFINSEIVIDDEPVGDVSLLSNKIRLPNTKEETNNSTDETNNSNSVAIKQDGSVALTNFGAGYLAKRSWQGLEQNLGQTEVHLAKEGRDGIPLHYKNEEK